jgi:FOG: CheY-like receiver
VQMPVMNGYEATKAIRSLKNQDLATIPIIAMTANAFEEDKQEAIRCGMNGHIAKPIDVDVLFETLRKMLS